MRGNASCISIFENTKLCQFSSCRRSTMYVWMYVCMDGWMDGCMYVCMIVTKNREKHDCNAK